MPQDEPAEAIKIIILDIIIIQDLGNVGPAKTPGSVSIRQMTGTFLVFNLISEISKF
jgi:hypothetical protein